MEGKPILVRIIDFVPPQGGELPTHLQGYPCVIRGKLYEFVKIVSSNEKAMVVEVLDNGESVITGVSTYIMVVYGQDQMYYKINKQSWKACFDKLALRNMKIINGNIIKNIMLPISIEDRNYIYTHTTTQTFHILQDGSVALT